jgi:hypothetical protein
VTPVTCTALPVKWPVPIFETLRISQCNEGCSWSLEVREILTVERSMIDSRSTGDPINIGFPHLTSNVLALSVPDWPSSDFARIRGGQSNTYAPGVSDYVRILIFQYDSCDQHREFRGVEIIGRKESRCELFRQKEPGVRPRSCTVAIEIHGRVAPWSIPTAAMPHRP